MKRSTSVILTFSSESWTQENAYCCCLSWNRIIRLLVTKCYGEFWAGLRGVIDDLRDVCSQIVNVNLGLMPRDAWHGGRFAVGAIA